MPAQFVMGGNSGMLQPSVVPQTEQGHMKEERIAHVDPVIDPSLAQAPSQFLRKTSPIVNDLVKQAKTQIDLGLEMAREANSSQILNEYQLAANEYMANLKNLKGQEGVEAAKRARQDLIEIGNKILDKHGEASFAAKNIAKASMEEILTDGSLQAQNHFIKAAHDFQSNELKATIDNKMQNATLAIGKPEFETHLDTVTQAIDNFLNFHQIAPNSEQGIKAKREYIDKVFKDGIDFLIDNEQLGAARTYLQKYRSKMSADTFYPLLAKTSRVEKSVRAREAGVRAARAQENYYRVMTAKQLMSKTKEIDKELYDPMNQAQVEVDAKFYARDLNVTYQQNLMAQKKAKGESTMLTPDEILQIETQAERDGMNLALQKAAACKKAQNIDNNLYALSIQQIHNNIDDLYAGKTPYDLLDANTRKTWHELTGKTADEINSTLSSMIYPDRQATEAGRTICSMDYEQMKADPKLWYAINHGVAIHKYLLEDRKMGYKEYSETLKHINTVMDKHNKGEFDASSYTNKVAKSLILNSLQVNSKINTVEKFNSAATKDTDNQQEIKLVIDLTNKAILLQQQTKRPIADCVAKVLIQENAVKQLISSAQTDANVFNKINVLCQAYPTFDREDILQMFYIAWEGNSRFQGAQTIDEAVAATRLKLEKELAKQERLEQVKADTQNFIATRNSEQAERYRTGEGRVKALEKTEQINAR